MNHSDSLAHIAPALVLVNTELRVIVKDSTNPHFKNKYASLEAITETVRPILVRNGLVIVQGCSPTESAELCVTTRLLHTSGEWIETYVFMPLEKPTPQGAGSAVTYGRRYGLSSILALSTDEDDDGNAGSAQRKAAPVRQAAPQSTAAPKPAHDSLVMPFGKQKGQPLNKFTAEQVQSAFDFTLGKSGYEQARADLQAELDRRDV